MDNKNAFEKKTKNLKVYDLYITAILLVTNSPDVLWFLFVKPKYKLKF
jgi:hypothetical protein